MGSVRAEFSFGKGGGAFNLGLGGGVENWSIMGQTSQTGGQTLMEGGVGIHITIGNYSAVCTTKNICNND